MYIEFHRASIVEGDDIHIARDGSLLIVTPDVMKLPHLKVGLEESRNMPSPEQIVSIYAMISWHRVVTVAFYFLDNQH